MQTLTEGGGGGGDQQAFSWLITLTMPNGPAANLMITLAHNMACHDKKYIALVLRAARLGNPANTKEKLSSLVPSLSIEGRKEGIGFYVTFNSLGCITMR